jgi:hypothetical protein
VVLQARKVGNRRKNSQTVKEPKKQNTFGQFLCCCVHEYNRTHDEMTSKALYFIQAPPSSALVALFSTIFSIT